MFLCAEVDRVEISTEKDNNFLEFWETTEIGSWKEHIFHNVRDKHLFLGEQISTKF